MIFVQRVQLLQRKGVDEDADRLVQVGAGWGPAGAAIDLPACKIFDLEEATGLARLVVDRELECAKA